MEVNGDKPVSFVAWTLINATPRPWHPSSYKRRSRHAPALAQPDRRYVRILLAGDLARPVRATMQNRRTADRWPLGRGVPDDGVTVEKSRVTPTITV